MVDDPGLAATRTGKGRGLVNPDRYRRVKEIFFQASELDEGGRDRMLERECSNDTEIRDEVLTLLDHHDTHTILAAPEMP